jgi:hypothetical protein
MPITCNFTPPELWQLQPCLWSVSKDLQGELLPLHSEKEECPKLDCVTLTTAHVIRARVTAHACDSSRSKPLDGALLVERLTTVFEAAEPTGRGIHVGQFRWVATGLVIDGTMRGVTNAGIMREPLRHPCEECRNPGVMIGQFCGTIRRGPPELVGAIVTGVYRFEFEPSHEGGRGPLRGVIEGAIMQDCVH